MLSSDAGHGERGKCSGLQLLQKRARSNLRICEKKIDSGIIAPPSLRFIFGRKCALWTGSAGDRCGRNLNSWRETASSSARVIGGGGRAFFFPPLLHDVTTGIVKESPAPSNYDSGMRSTTTFCVHNFRVSSFKKRV